MIKTLGPRGTVALSIHACLNGQRTEPRTKDREIAAAIEKLDRRGVWHWLRHAALWQAPELLSEDEQLAVVLTEIGDPDHPQHSGVAYIHEALGANGILRARDAVARQGTADAANMGVLDPTGGPGANDGRHKQRSIPRAVPVGEDQRGNDGRALLRPAR